MKLVVVEYGARSRYITRHAFWIVRALAQYHGWTVLDTHRLAHWRGTLAEICDRLFGRQPKTILFWENYHLAERFRRELEGMDATVSISADDFHWHSEGVRRQKEAVYDAADRVIATYGYAFDRFFPKLAGRVEVHWVPNSASPDFLLEYREKAENKVLLSGKINRYYPLREQLHRMAHEGEAGIAIHPHPGYHCRYDHDTDGRAGRGYARILRQYRAAFTDLSILGYLVAKHFEIPAVGTLLLAERNAEPLLEELGYEPGRHYLTVKPKTLAERIRYVRDPAHHAELDAIRFRARKLVRGRHTTDHRAREIDRIIAGG